MALKPRPTVVVIEGEPQQYSEYSGAMEAEDPFDLGFWGRGVAATWRLYIEQEEIDDHHIDLAQLSEIQIGIGYECFYKPNPN